MDRGLKVPLSPSEEVTLRRIDYGIAMPSDLVAGDIKHLYSLALIERQDDRLGVTALGRQRLLAMRGSVPLDTDEQVAKLFDKIIKKPTS